MHILFPRNIFELSNQLSISIIRPHHKGPASELTPARTHSIGGLKFRVLKFTFLAENDGEKRPRIIYLEIHRSPSELLLHSAKKSAHLACQVSRYL